MEGRQATRRRGKARLTCCHCRRARRMQCVPSRVCVCAPGAPGIGRPFFTSSRLMTSPSAVSCSISRRITPRGPHRPRVRRDVRPISRYLSPAPRLNTGDVSAVTPPRNDGGSHVCSFHRMQLIATPDQHPHRSHIMSFSRITRILGSTRPPTTVPIHRALAVRFCYS